MLSLTGAEVHVTLSATGQTVKLRQTLKRRFAERKQTHSLGDRKQASQTVRCLSYVYSRKLGGGGRISRGKTRLGRRGTALKGDQVRSVPIPSMICWRQTRRAPRTEPRRHVGWSLSTSGPNEPCRRKTGRYGQTYRDTHKQTENSRGRER